jgi:hypothetical protein
MGIEKMGEVVTIEPARGRKPVTQHRVTHALLERPAEPARQRHRKAHLLPIQDVV